MHSLALYEHKQHGTPEFPVAYHYVDSHHPRYRIPFHWHNEWELLHILEGSFQLRMDDDEYLAQAGDVFLINSGMLHGGTPIDCTYECLVFDLHGLFRGIEAAKKDLRPFYRQILIPYHFFPSMAQPRLCSIVREGLSAFRQERCHELETIGFLCRMFSLIRTEGLYIQTSDGKYNPTARISQLKSVLNYVETHYSEPLRLESLAQIAGMNPRYFCRIFRSVTGYSPMGYVNFYRIERAAYLLSASALSVTGVGLECGFTETSYFTKVFRKHKGVSPRQYRSSHRD